MTRQEPFSGRDSKGGIIYIALPCGHAWGADLMAPRTCPFCDDYEEARLLHALSSVAEHQALTSLGTDEGPKAA